MNEKLIVGLSDLFKQDKDIVIKTLENKEGDDSLLNTWKEGLVIKPKTEYDSYIENLVNETKQNYLSEIKEKAKKKELDQELYGFFKGNVTEEIERKLSKAFDISDYENFEDLTNKIKSKKIEDTKLKTDFEELQKINKKLVEDKDNAIKKAEEKFNNELISRDKISSIASIKLDYADEAIEKQRKLLQAQIESQYKFGRVDGKTVVLDMNGNIVKDKNTLSPLSISDVAINVAKDFDFKLKSPETGGQGGTSSENNIGIKVSFDEYCKQKNVRPFTSEADKLYAEWKKNN